MKIGDKVKVISNHVWKANKETIGMIGVIGRTSRNGNCEEFGWRVDFYKGNEMIDYWNYTEEEIELVEEGKLK